MKSQNLILKRIVTLALAVTAAALLNGCGKDSDDSTTTYGQYSCSIGQVYNASYGCLNQSTCATGYGLYNGTCVAGTVVTSSSGCIALNQTIPFAGSGLSIDGSNNIYGGSIPSGGTYGSMGVGVSQSVSGNTFTSVSTGTGYSVGTFSMAVQSSNSGYYTTSTAAVSGSLTIGSYYQQLIQTYWASSYGAGSTACVSGIAIYGHLYTSGTYGFGGYVYLYLNGTSHGYRLTYQ